MNNSMDLSVIIPAHNEGENLLSLLPNIRAILDKLGISYEVLVVCRAVDALTARAAEASGARTLEQTERGYGGALIAGFKAARGAYYLTMDADLSHPPAFILDLWGKRERADVIIASRYVSGVRGIMPWGRYVLSRVLNAVFSRGLSLGVGDMSSGFRLYNASA